MAVEPSTTERPAEDAASDSVDDRARLLTVPNLITGARLAGTVGLVALAVSGHAKLFAILFVVLIATDWVDGRLARWLNQRSDLGARLDSLADAVLFANLIFGGVLLKRDFAIAEKWWIVAAVSSYLLTTGAGLWKFGRVPAYHTWAAKVSWHLTLIAVIFMFFDWSPWPFRIAMLAVTLTNLEATLITRTLPHWQADVKSLLRARRIRDGATAESPATSVG